MNARIRCFTYIASCLLAVAVVPLSFTGCASTPTRESTGEYVDDSTITAKIKAVYAKDPVVSALQVHVETYKGVVQLSGFVDSQEASSKAEELARNVNGVTKVDNNLVIRSASGATENK